jgi:hypothetical protein
VEGGCDNSSQLSTTLYPEDSEEEVLTTKLLKTFMNVTAGKSVLRNIQERLLTS